MGEKKLVYWLNNYIDAIEDNYFTDDVVIYSSSKDLKQIHIDGIEYIAEMLDLEVKEDLETYKDDDAVEKVIYVEYRDYKLRELIMKRGNR